MLLALAACPSACGIVPRLETRSAEQRVLEHQVRSLRAMARSSNDPAARDRADDVLVAVDAGLIEDTLNAATPWSGLVADRFTVEVRHARVTLEGGVALVRLSGCARPLADGSAEVGLRLHAAIADALVDPATRALRATVSLIAFEVEGGEDGRSAAHDLAESLAGLGLEAFAQLVSGIDVPVAVAEDVELPRLGPRPIAVEALAVPASLAATAVWAFRGRLWIALDARAMPQDGAKQR